MSSAVAILNGKWKLLPKVIRHCLNADFYTWMEDFFAKHKDSFGPIEEKEYRLCYTPIHNDFVKQFEGQVEAYIKEQKSTVDQFYELCRTANKMGDSNTATFVDVLMKCLDFQTFVDLAKDSAKQQYFYGIMKSYGKMIDAYFPAASGS